jgi:hypothetical protein
MADSDAKNTDSYRIFDILSSRARPGNKKKNVVIREPKAKDDSTTISNCHDSKLGTSKLLTICCSELRG